METLKLGNTLQTREPQVLLDPTLKPGKYRVLLSVVGASGESDPAELRIAILAPDPRPTDVRPTDLRPGVVAPVVVRGLARGTAPVIAAAPARAPTKPKPGAKPPRKPKRK